MLVIVNAFLLVLVLDRENKSARYEHRAREEAASILARSGITIGADVIPKDLSLTTMVVASDAATEKAQAAALVGEDAVMNAKGTYTGATGATVRFYADGAFAFYAAPGSNPLNGTSPSKAALEFIKKLDLTGKVTATNTADDEDTVTVQLYWNGIPIFAPSKTVVKFRAGELHSIEGYRLVGVPAVEDGKASLSVVTILLRLLDHITSNTIVCRSITEITEGYTLVSAQGSTPKLVPTWRIITDTNPDGYYLNAVTGEIL
ncbi:MAG: hypothetical protein EOM52_03560 [Clostridia bacterium]|nr:hypothetical protein [Clostridia bacterium]